LYLIEWIAVKYIEDNVFYMCPSKTIKSKIEIGKKCMVKWVDKKPYLAKVLKRGSKLYIIIDN